ncbi:type I glyceraldehyde-3-phosphate dehydrogenase [Candidatus Parcubacteria bacterium]|nr:type I glyceraldehyde-3-phosphate dehydrogenase [Candidatus Parcubacteria bacterium]
MTKIAINGFGRIGRATFKRILEKHPDLKVEAINDLTDTKTLAHLLKYDSVYGIYRKTVRAKEKALIINGQEIKIFAEKEPNNLPWKKLGIDIVLECTGVFRDYEGGKKHIEAGAKKVIISAPSKTPEKVPSYILGVNEEKYNPEKDEIMDMGSCTTNCLAPVVKVLHDNFKIVKGFMTTVHSYTTDQKLLDLPHKDLRRARAAAINIVPTTTGATKAIGKVIPEVEGKLDGLAIRVPTPTVSIVDLICELEKKTTKKEVNSCFKKAAQSKAMKGILDIEQEPLVSSDYIANPFSSIVDSDLTMVKDNLVKVISWYDNEYGYSCRMAEFAEFIGRKF